MKILQKLRVGFFLIYVYNNKLERIINWIVKVCRTEQSNDTTDGFFPTQFAYIIIYMREGILIMYKINFDQPVHVHFIGIGGISMSGLAEVLLEENFTVSGSDNKESALTDHLEKAGAQIFYGQKASNIIDGIDVVVYTAAIHKDNEEYQTAVQKDSRC